MQKYKIFSVLCYCSEVGRERLSEECLSFYESVYDQIIAKAYDENPLPEIKEKIQSKVR